MSCAGRAAFFLPAGFYHMISSDPIALSKIMCYNCSIQGTEVHPEDVSGDQRTDYGDLP